MSMHNASAQGPDTSLDNDINMVELWLRKDPARWIAGAIAGMFSGLMALVVGAIVAVCTGREALFSVKAAALPVLGASATELGFHLPAILTGLVVAMALFGVFGFAFGHFVTTNKFMGLLGMGFTWGAFSWIFLSNLFVQSFTAFRFAKITQAGLFPVMFTYGFSLMSIAFFDRLVRGKSN